MNILVIGNGFDLAHGLPTKYKDFMDFIKYFKIMYKSKEIETIRNAKIFKELNNYVQEYLLNKLKKDKKNKLIEELYELSLDNVWINYLQECIKDNKLKGKNWIDFEYEISQVIKGLEYVQKKAKEKMKKGKENFKIDDNDLFKKGEDFLNKFNCDKKNKFPERVKIEDFYGNTSKKVINILNEELNKLIRCLEIYLGDVVEMINIEKTLPDIKEIKSIDKLISFNYTNTFKRIYDKNGRIENDYIHGRVNTDKTIVDNNMVLGIDEYLQGNEKREELDFIQFKKYFQRIYKKTGCNYKHWLTEAKRIPRKVSSNGLSNDGFTEFANNIYIYGHSLDITDKDIIRELLALHNTQVNIYYYDKADYAQKIRNMVTLIGQDELINSVHGEVPRIVFKEIQNKISNLQ